MVTTEPFPKLDTGRIPPLSKKSNGSVRQRRSSGLGGEIRAGDTSVPAAATWDIPPLSPATVKAHNIEERRRPHSKRRKMKTFLRRSKRHCQKHTYMLPLILLLLFAAGYAVNPRESNPIHHFIFLSYKIPHPPGTPDDEPHQYGKGWWDCAFVAFYTIFLSFTREFIMQKFLRPFAKRSGLKSRAKQSRFMEQAYTAIYFGILGPLGLWVMSRTDLWYFRTRPMYEQFPHKTHTWDFKVYYLFEAAYWAQQAIVLVLGLEKARKDFKELVGHHIVSLALIGLSYRFHFTHMGLAVYITHDISDFFLATSKLLNYLDHWLVPPYFATFVVVWIYARHYLNWIIIISLFYEYQTVGPFELNWETEQYKCWISFYITTALLMSLQSLNLFWLWHILRIGYRFVFLKIAKDDRSEDDEEELRAEMEAERLRAKERELMGLAANATSDEVPLLEITEEAAATGVEVVTETDEVTNRREKVLVSS